MRDGEGGGGSLLGWKHEWGVMGGRGNGVGNRKKHEWADTWKEKGERKGMHS